MAWPNNEAVQRAVAAWRDYPRAGGAHGLAVAMLTAAGLPELVGTNAAAKMLGVESSNLSRLVGLPEPLYQLRAGRFYDAAEIRALAERRAAS